MSEPRKYARGGEIVSGFESPADSVSVLLSRGEAYLPRATFERVGIEAIRKINGGDTHVFVVESDGSVTDTEDDED